MSPNKLGAGLGSTALLLCASWVTGCSNNNGNPDLGPMPDQSIPLGVMYAPAATYGLGQKSYGLVLGDLNGDGKLDVAATNSGSGNVSVLLNQGGGVLGGAVNYAAGNGPETIVAADFDGDAKLDLAVNSETSGVIVLLNQGGGVFSTATPHSVGASNSSTLGLAVADMNMDGKVDIIATNHGTDQVGILINQGGGNFSAAQLTASTKLPWSVVAADFNGDAKPDLVVSSLFQGTLGTQFNQGSGVLSTFQKIGSGDVALAVGDVNGDGKADILLASSNSAVSVFLNQGAGAFGAAKDYNTANIPHSIVTADLNGDGKTDIAIADFTGNKATVLLNQDNTSFGMASSYPVGTNPVEIAVGDLNGDKIPDLVVVNNDLKNPGTLSVLLSK